MTRLTGQGLKAMTPMEFTKAIQALPLDFQVRLAVARINWTDADYQEIAEILNEFMEVKQ